MTKKLTLEEVREFWRTQAIEHQQSAAASWSDVPVIEMEIREITQYLNDGDRVLDIGCANGYSTLQFAAQRAIHLRGLDYIPEMIAQAQVRLQTMAAGLRGTAEFGVGDITNLATEAAGTYDKVIVIRVIINLGNWANQVVGLQEAARMLKPGGTLLLSEATLQGWQRINALRREWSLTEIPMPGFNNYLDENQVVAALAPTMDLVKIVSFSSTYFVGTRVLKPLLIQALNLPLQAANPNMEWNRWFSQLPAWGDYGTQKLFVFQKR